MLALIYLGSSLSFRRSLPAFLPLRIFSTLLRRSRNRRVTSPLLVCLPSSAGFYERVAVEGIGQF